jgi:catechol 2,3-dioxygenase-like lactoylglutathione lyase family enzyme
MKKVTGIGGIFFKAKDPDKLRAWYRQHLGIEAESWGYHFQWSDDPQKDGGTTVWSVFPETTKYFEPSTQPFMINFRVADLARFCSSYALMASTSIPKAATTLSSASLVGSWIPKAIA